MTTLGNERGGNATTQHVQYTKQFWDAVELTRKYGLEHDPVVRQQLAWAYTHTEIMIRPRSIGTCSSTVLGACCRMKDSKRSASTDWMSRK